MALKVVTNAKAVGLDEFPVELFQNLGHDQIQPCPESSTECPKILCGVKGKTTTAARCNNQSLTRKGQNGAGNIKVYQSSHTRKRFSRVATRLGAHCEAGGPLPEEQCGFRSRRSTIHVIPAVRRLQELGRKSCVPLLLCLIRQHKA